MPLHLILLTFPIKGRFLQEILTDTGMTEDEQVRQIRIKKTNADRKDEYR